MSKEQQKTKKGYSTWFICALAIIIGGALLQQRYVIKILAYVRENKPHDDYQVGDFSFFWITLVSAAVQLVVRQTYEKVTLNFWLGKSKNQTDPEVRHKYGMKLVDQTYKFAWNVSMVAYGFSVLKDTPVHHFWIGGQETTSEGLYANLPFHDDRSMYMYCLIAHGYHFSNLVRYTFFVERMNDYEAMMIHHVATNYLLVNSNYGAFHRYGAVILFLHDVPDVFVALVRITEMMGYKIATFFLGYMPLLLSWIYFRVFYFSWVIYGLVMYAEYPPHLSEWNQYLKNHAFFLTTLWLLHIFWLKLIIDMGLRYICTGKVDDTIRDVRQSKGEVQEPASPPSKRYLSKLVDKKQQ